MLPNCCLTNRRRTIALRLIAVMLACAALTQCSRSMREPLGAGERAPEFSLDSLAGEKVALKDLKKKGIVLLNFWATWCAPCKAEIPLLDQLSEKLQDKGLTVVGVSVQERKDSVAAFCRKNRVKYPILLDSDADVSKQYGVFAFPTTIVLSQDGVVLLQQSKTLDQQTLLTIESMVGGDRVSAQHGPQSP
jgi:peroxiredoxin